MSNIWHMLNIDSLAIDAGFGLEYYLLGDMSKAKPLLTKGIQFCDMILNGNLATTQKVISSSYLDAWEDIQILVKCKSQDELNTIVENAIHIKIDLTEIVQENTVCSKEKIIDMQKFFIDASKPYISRAYNIMRRRERCRHL